jgi:hypothetical protein
MGNEVAVKSMMELSTVRPDHVTNQARGNESVTTDDMSVPRISMIQDLSPQHKKGKPEYIDGAAVGMAFNTATNELYGSYLYAIPVYFKKEWVLWKDRKKGGGFGGSFKSKREAESALHHMEDGSDYDVVDTGQHYCLVVNANDPLPAPKQAVVSMSKSQMKVSRQWNTIIATTGEDRFARVYKLEVVDDQNKNGDDFQNWRVSSVGYTPKDMYEAAEHFYDSIASGEVVIKGDMDTGEDFI